MDYTTIDVTEIPLVSVEDVVTFIGADGENRIDVEEIAGLAETIAYEITCAVGRRVQRVCIGGHDLILPAQPPRDQVVTAPGEPEEVVDLESPQPDQTQVRS